ncbi:MAG TPA: hypothetical protein VHQ47_08930 [Phycisphaerae bacterium]|jgi:Holliday junction resolvasome RuvABC endonuclease subunit|nr:hypothetical protein [Phycisphaerae bacterium]
MILALDPSSTKVGYALMRGPSDLHEAGLLKPGKTKDDAIIRIPALAAEVSALIAQEKPTEVVIEVSMSSHGHAGQAGARTLHVYGMAVGYCWAVAEALMPGNVATVDANTWTGRVTKATRTQRVARLFPQYKPDTDRGGDIADAIGLGRYYLMRMGAPRNGDGVRIEILPAEGR